MDKILWHYDENNNVIIEDSPDREPYPFSLVLDFFPYSSAWWYKAIVIDKIVSIILDDTIFIDIKDEFEKILSGEVHQSKAITHMVNYCSMMRRDVQFVARIADKEHKSGDMHDNDESRITKLEAENEQLKARITELETELTTCREQLEAAQRDISGKEGLEPAHGEEFPVEYEGHGIFTMLAKLVDARTPVVDIMAALDDEKNFLSQRENGYFFHPAPEEKSASTLRNYTKNTLKKRVANG